MKQFLRTYGTTLTIGLFAVSTISGVFLFFHIWSRTFHAMHEWLSMVLLIPVVFHVWRNWPAFSKYFQRKSIYIALFLSLIGSLAFAYPALTGNSTGNNPMRAAVSAIQKGSVQQIAPLFDLTPQALKDRLEQKGYIVTALDQKLSSIAKRSGKERGPSLITDISTP